MILSSLARELCLVDLIVPLKLLNLLLKVLHVDTGFGSFAASRLLDIVDALVELSLALLVLFFEHALQTLHIVFLAHRFLKTTQAIFSVLLLILALSQLLLQVVHCKCQPLDIAVLLGVGLV